MESGKRKTENDRKKVLTFGTFDHLHEGHKAYLQFAASKGDLYIIVARDSNVEHIKGKRPDHSETERMDALQKEFPNADVRLGDESDYLAPIRDVKPDLIVMGYDQKLPPSIDEKHLPCPIERADSHSPEKYKSSLMRGE